LICDEVFFVDVIAFYLYAEYFSTISFVCFSSPDIIYLVFFFVVSIVNATYLNPNRLASSFDLSSGLLSLLLPALHLISMRRDRRKPTTPKQTWRRTEKFVFKGIRIYAQRNYYSVRLFVACPCWSVSSSLSSSANNRKLLIFCAGIIAHSKLLGRGAAEAHTSGARELVA
jgi:hypothetical protein